MNEFEEIKTTVCYFAQKITGCEAIALAKAILMVKELNKLGLTVFSPGIHSIPQFYMGIKKNWLKEDLNFLEHWLCQTGHFNGNFWNPGITMIFDSSCFKDLFTKYFDEGQKRINFEDESNWNSPGAYKEYLWAKGHNVRCILAEALVENQIIRGI